MPINANSRRKWTTPSLTISSALLVKEPIAFPGRAVYHRRLRYRCTRPYQECQPSRFGGRRPCRSSFRGKLASPECVQYRTDSLGNKGGWTENSRSWHRKRKTGLPEIIPPRSVFRLARCDLRTKGWKADVGRVFRIGYYSRQDGLDTIWLVDELGKYEQTTDRDFLLKYFQ